MSSKPRLDKALALRRARPYQQFGQTDDEYTFNGATGCTHTCLQTIALIWKDRYYSHDQISKLVGYPAPGNNGRMRGLNYTEVQRFFTKTGIPYKVKLGLSADAVLKASNLGPVLFGHAYSWTPEWYGRTYNGIKADGKPNGYASPLGKAGKTQLSGFTGAHASLLLGYLTSAYVHEPNHGSPARKEKPPYDTYSITEFKRMYDSYKRTLGRTPYAVVPTRGL